MLPSVNNIKTITDVREDTLGFFKNATKKGPVFVFHRSEPIGVVLSPKKFNELLETIEDYHDSLLALELEKQVEQTPVSQLILADKALKKVSTNDKSPSISY